MPGVSSWRRGRRCASGTSRHATISPRRSAGCPAGQRGAVQLGDRRTAVPQPPHRGVAPEQGVRKARDQLPQGAPLGAIRRRRSHRCRVAVHGPPGSRGPGVQPGVAPGAIDARSHDHACVPVEPNQERTPSSWTCMIQWQWSPAPTAGSAVSSPRSCSSAAPRRCTPPRATPRAFRLRASLRSASTSPTRTPLPGRPRLPATPR